MASSEGYSAEIFRDGVAERGVGGVGDDGREGERGEGEGGGEMLAGARASGHGERSSSDRSRE